MRTFLGEEGGKGGVPQPSLPGPGLPASLARSGAWGKAWVQFSPEAWLALVFQDGPWDSPGEGAGDWTWLASVLVGCCQGWACASLGLAAHLLLRAQATPDSATEAQEAAFRGFLEPWTIP